MSIEEETARHGSQVKVSSIITFLVANRMYPMFSTKGKIFFQKSKNTLLSDKRAQEIIDQLNLKKAEDCKRIREFVKERVDQQWKNRPIRT